MYQKIMDSDGDIYSDNESESRQVEDINPNDTDDDMNEETDSDVDEHAEGDQVAEEPLEPIQIQIIVPEDERITTNMMTKFEFTNLVGTRAQQIDKSGIYYADLKNQNMGHLNALDVAILELQQKKCPLLIKRHIDNKHIEIFNPNEMIIPKVNIKPHID